MLDMISSTARVWIAYLRSMDSMMPHMSLFDKSSFTLDIGGLIGGLLGGDNAILAMATVNVFGRRRWLGWQHSPGSYEIGRRYAYLANARFLNCSSPGIHTDPIALLGVDAPPKGPKFRAAHSDTILAETGPFAALFMQDCTALQAKIIQGEKSKAIGVTVAELNHVPVPRMKPSCTTTYSPFVSSIPIFISLCSCIACGVVADWLAFWSIFFGILASGVSSLVIGSGTLVFTHPDTACGSPRGDGILISEQEIIVLRGAEGAVNSITHGRLSFCFPCQFLYGNISRCSFLFTMQFVIQLLFIPKCTFFGQIMFAISLGVSAIYNMCLSSDKQKIQSDILLNGVLKRPVLTKYSFTRTTTTMVVFILLVLQSKEPAKILDELLPNNDKTWRQWKETIVTRLVNKENFKFADSDWELDGFSQEERSALKTWYGDAKVAYDTYFEYLASK